jgi:hypothetical protein
MLATPIVPFGRRPARVSRLPIRRFQHERRRRKAPALSENGCFSQRGGRAFGRRPPKIAVVTAQILVLVRHCLLPSLRGHRRCVCEGCSSDGSRSLQLHRFCRPQERPARLPQGYCYRKILRASGHALPTKHAAPKLQSARGAQRVNSCVHYPQLVLPHAGGRIA